MNIRKNISIFADRFQKKQTMTWASSLAFYTALSLAPLLVLFLVISSQLSPDLQKNFINEIHSLMGADAATAIVLVLQNAKSRPDLMSFSGVVSIATLLLSASLIFGELRAALNSIFEKETSDVDLTFWQTSYVFLKARFLQMGLVLGFLFIIIVSLVVSTVISSSIASEANPVGVVINILLSAAIYIMLFSILFYYVPEHRLPWKRSIQGGIITAFLFIVGKEIIGIYLGHSAISSSYGAAGSLVVLLAWVYYSAMIIFVGAHISYLLHSREQVPENKKTARDQYLKTKPFNS